MPKSKIEEGPGFSLIPEDQEDMIPQRMDKNLVLLRQIDRINRLAAMGDTSAYINSVQQLHYFLNHMRDKKFNTEIEQEEAAYKRICKTLTTEEVNEKLNCDITFYGQKFMLLMDLMRRRGIL